MQSARMTTARAQFSINSCFNEFPSHESRVPIHLVFRVQSNSTPARAAQTRANEHKLAKLQSHPSRSVQTLGPDRRLGAEPRPRGSRTPPRGPARGGLVRVPASGVGCGPPARPPVFQSRRECSAMLQPEADAGLWPDRARMSEAIPNTPGLRAPPRAPIRARPHRRFSRQRLAETRSPPAGAAGPAKSPARASG